MEAMFPPIRIEFVIRSHFTDATLQWAQSDTIGAFIVM
jgi:hypothetical protein